jgi:acyl-coenzyme A thioesterase PaaI-like protein
MGFLTLDAMQELLSPGGDFSPWIWELRLKAEHVSAEQVRVWLPHSDHVARPGGVMTGQATSALSDTIVVLASCERLGRFATLVTISPTANFAKLGHPTIFDEVDLFADGSDEPIAQAISSFALMPDGAGAFNCPDQR